jgi:hypothetical protein
MPIGRYFLYIGGVLLALLLIADWYFPPLDAEQSSSSNVDRTTIRLHSTYKWPNAVVFDTTQPIVAPPPVTIVAAPAPPPPSAKSAREAYAMASEPVAAAKPAEPVKAAKSRVRRTRTARAPGSEMSGYRNDWFAPPRREAFASSNGGFAPRGFWPSW